MKKRIISSFIYCRDGELIKITRRILDSIKQSTNFPNAGLSLELIEKALEDYALALSAAGSRDRVLASVKDDKKAILQQLLKELAYYITQTAKGDKTLLLESGFELNVERGASQTAVPKLKVNIEVPGQATVSVPRATGARAYVHQYTPDPLTPQSVWVSETSLKPQHTFNGFESAAKIWVRIIVIDKKGESIYWEPVSRIVQ
ncbi:MAG TPA: hypothetical protein VM187_05250 [Niastella sp.]|nr:hypothetical protein [Niastella sp.]